MRPLFVEELAVHPGHQGRGIGAFVLEQVEHMARVRGCTHIVLEVAENNENALKFYRGRTFYKLDAAIFMAKKVTSEPELLPPRTLKKKRPRGTDQNRPVRDGSKAASRSYRQDVSCYPDARSCCKSGALELTFVRQLFGPHFMTGRRGGAGRGARSRRRRRRASCPLSSTGRFEVRMVDAFS
jgi:hypothetical protein